MKRTLHFEHNGTRTSVTLEGAGSQWQATVGSHTYAVVAQPGERGRLALEIDGVRTLTHVAQAGAQHYVHAHGATWELARVASAHTRAASGVAQGNTLVATMPGRVLDLLVVQGEAVARGQPLVLLEAMKMELRLTAPHDGIVSNVQVAAGNIVARGQLLLEVTPAP